VSDKEATGVSVKVHRHDLDQTCLNLHSEQTF